MPFADAWSRSRENAERFAAEQSEAAGVRIEVAASGEEAVRGAGIDHAR